MKKNKKKETALYHAVRNNSKEIAELHISHGANINDEFIFGYTALHKAAINNNSKETAELLNSHGANFNEKYKN